MIVCADIVRLRTILLFPTLYVQGNCIVGPEYRARKIDSKI